MVGGEDEGVFWGFGFHRTYLRALDGSLFQDGEKNWERR